jgi:dehydrogenase/reductase SDR family member 1
VRYSPQAPCSNLCCPAKRVATGNMSRWPVILALSGRYNTGLVNPGRPPESNHCGHSAAASKKIPCGAGLAHFSNTSGPASHRIAEMKLYDRVAIVTGATKGVGRGVARVLAAAGARVFATGRSAPDRGPLEEQITGICCDHRIDSQVEAAFNRIVCEANTIDILVNSVWGGYERMVDNGVFTWSKPFWEQPLWRWDAMFSAGVRAHYLASQLVVPAMIAQRRGLIVNISFWAAQKHVGNVAYGMSKAATDKMTADMATELKPYGVAVVSLYPGLVRTEKVMESAKWLDLSNSESPEFVGQAVAALAADPDVLRYTGNVLVAASLAREYGFTDLDGKTPRPLTLADV